MKIPRRVYLDASRDQSSDARCISRERGMSRRAKKQGSKRLRMILKKQIPKDSA